MADSLDNSFFKQYLFGQTPEGFKGTTGFKGGQMRRLDALNQIYKAIQGTSDLGPAGESQISTWEKQTTGEANQNAISRGLGNSTILGSNETGIKGQGSQMRLALKESIQNQINQLRTTMADVYTRGSFGQAPIQKQGFDWGGLLGGAAGSFFGPMGGAVGKRIGSGIGKGS